MVKAHILTIKDCSLIAERLNHIIGVETISSVEVRYLFLKKWMFLSSRDKQNFILLEPVNPSPSYKVHAYFTKDFRGMKGIKFIMSLLNNRESIIGASKLFVDTSKKEANLLAMLVGFHKVKNTKMLEYKEF